MPTAAGLGSPTGGVAPPVIPVVMPASPIPETFARDAIISWFRGEFAAANAIIDALCSHLAQLEGNFSAGGQGSVYESVFAAIHRRRLFWVPILQMQKYHSIADVAIELKRVAARKMEENGIVENKIEEKVTENEEVKVCLEETENRVDEESSRIDEKVMEIEGNGGGEVVEEEDSPDSEITDGGSQEVQTPPENIEICSNHEECEARPAQIKMTKGFVAKEPVKRHMINVVRGLKLYEDVFTESEFSKLTDFVNELRVAGQNGELPGDTFKIFNQQMKGNKRELIQFGVPIFGQIKEEVPSTQQTNNIQPIPPLLQNVIDHLAQWCLIPNNRKPNGCIINFFDEGEYSQPCLKPPHVDQPISILLLSESTMAFGCTLVSDNEGNYKAPLKLSLKEGSLLFMKGNSADTAAHAICPSPNKRASITFFRIRPQINENNSLIISTQDKTMTFWQSGIPNPYTLQNGALNGYETMDMIPKWGGFLSAPMVMVSPVRPMVLSPKRIPQGGTGVFLPWSVNSKRHTKHLPPRAQKSRLLALPSPVETNVAEPISESGITVS